MSFEPICKKEIFFNFSSILFKITQKGNLAQYPAIQNYPNI